jgi:predicted nucleic acid-binding protein
MVHRESLVNNLDLLTRNVKDFNGIDELTVANPFDET